MTSSLLSLPSSPLSLLPPSSPFLIRPGDEAAQSDPEARCEKVIESNIAAGASGLET
jgi:hypothetical protein